MWRSAKLKNSLSLLLSLGCCVITQGIYLKTATAQITSDGTTNTTVDVRGNDFTINNGDRAGGNLFHSFSEFSVPTDGSGFFNNAADIVNIFSRVTGGNISNIDGFLRANGTANLFLINPAGIIFGEGARVNIGGSFYGSTADSIIFPDGELSATNLADPPLITINAPIGLNFRDNPGDINVRGNELGQRLIDTEEAFRINSDAIFALVGGKINLQRATIKTIRGQIEIGSVAENEQVTLNPIDQRFNLDYGNVQNFDNISLNASQIESSTLQDGNGGNIKITANSVNITDSAFIATRTSGTGNAGDIDVNAGAFNLSDSSISTNTFGTGNAGNITVNAGSVNINNSSVTADTSGRGNAGAIDIEVTDAGAFNLSRSSITTRSFGTGNGGSIDVSFGLVNITNSSLISTETSGIGNAGTIDIDVTNAGSFNLSDSSIFTRTFRTGNGGSIDVSSGSVNITNSSVISTETSGRGNAGTIDIDVTNAGPFNLSDSSITTSTFGTGNGGSIDVSSGSVNITNSSINTNSEQGNGGSINVTSGSLTLDQGEISAQTNSGNGGSLDINVDHDLLMRNNSQISTNALTNGNGGDITINARFIIGFPSTGLGNDIRSDSKQRGEGGNINIKTNGGIFNFEISSDTAGIFNNTNDIDASSEFGLDGNVSIENPDTNELQGMNRLLTNPVSAETIATDVCSSTGDGSRLIYKGRGGVTPPPTAPLTAEALISDGQPITVDQETELDSLVEGKLENIPEDPNYIPEDIKPIKISIGDIYPARGIIKTENGEIILTAYPTKDINTRTPHKSANCASS